MAIINCPSCQKKVSDKIKNCPECQFDFIHNKSSDGLTEEQLASKKNLQRIKRKYSLQMRAMTGIIMVLGGVLVWYFGGRGLLSISDYLSVAAIGVGSILYLMTRIHLILYRRGR
ncbi:MAG: hypothetical protein Q9M92_04520 [Enterobacterales bacterium]|nr:hypothetical protein [Enterobacterales bacterium]